MAFSHQPNSVSASVNFNATARFTDIMSFLTLLLEDLAYQLRSQDLKTEFLCVKMYDRELGKEYIYKAQLSQPIHTDMMLLTSVQKMLEPFFEQRLNATGIVLIAADLSASEQHNSIYDNEQRLRKLYKSLDALRNKHGKPVASLASTYNDGAVFAANNALPQINQAYPFKIVFLLIMKFIFWLPPF